MQERVVVVGEWRHGSFNLAAVAASNVGNIRLDRDPVSRRRASLLRSPAPSSEATRGAEQQWPFWVVGFFRT